MEKQNAALLIDEAFRRFGAAFLWNVRRPTDKLRSDAAYIRAIAGRLRREGNEEAMVFAARILQALERAEAAGLSAQEPWHASEDAPPSMFPRRLT